MSNITASSVVISATSSATADKWDFSIDNGVTWSALSNSVGTTVSKSATGLPPNTTYNVIVRVRKQSNQVYGYSPTITFTTLGNSLLNSVSTFTVDAPSPVLTMNWTVYASYTHTLVIKDGTKTVLTLTDLTCSTGTNNKTVTLTAEQRATILRYMASKQSFTATFELSTYSGSTQIGSTVSNTALIQTTYENSAPTFVDFTHRDYNRSGTVDITGNNQVYIKSQSSMYIEIGEQSAKNEATILAYRVTVGSVSKTYSSASMEFGTIGVYGDNVSLKVEVIDSRGYSTAITKAIKVVNYENISITEYSIRRVNEVEPTVQLSFSGDISPITVDGENKNSLKSYRLHYSKDGGETWYGWVTLSGATQTSRSFEFSTEALTNMGNVLQFDPEYQYEFEIEVSDRLTSDKIPITLNKGTPLVSFRSKKVGINTADPQAALHIIGDMMINDGIVADFIVERGTDGIWSYEKWYSGKARCVGTTASIDFEFKNDWIVDTYFNSTSYNLPEGLFVSTPEYVNIQTISTDGLHSNCLYALTNAKISWYAISHGAQAKTRSLKFLLLAEGKWK